MLSVITLNVVAPTKISLLVTLTPNLIKHFTTVKLERSYLASHSSLVGCLWVRPL
jgi:hypothetical protein